MARKILIVKPYSKLAAAHKLFATFMKLLIMSKIEVIDKSASTYCFTNPDFLLLCWIYFRLEALQQFPHPFLLAKAMNDQSIPPGEGILHHAEGVDLIPANIELAGLEVSLVNCMNREKMLKQVLEGVLTVNALAAADAALDSCAGAVPVRKRSGTTFADISPCVRRQINPKLKNRGYSADHDRQPHQLRKADQQSDPGRHTEST